MKNKIKKLTKIGVLIFGISLLLWNCETDSEIIEPIQEKTDFTLKPKIETFSLNQLNEDHKFKELKNTYRILQNNTLAKSAKTNSLSARLVDTLGITIDANSIKRISYDNYTSYTMLMIELEDTSNNFSNLVIQEYNGNKRIFTVRYFPNETKSKSSTYASKSSTESFNGDIQMRSGITTTELWGDDDGSGGGSGTSGCEEYETVCNTVNVWSSLCSCVGHFPEEYCTCTGPRIDFVQTIEECEDICIWDNYNDQTGGNNNDGYTSGGGNTSNTGDNTEPTDVATSPVSPDGTVPDQIFLDQEFEDNPCLKSVYDNMGKTAAFKSYLENFEPEFSVAHLRFSSSTTLPANTNAETSAPQNYLITITFNENNLNRPNLSIARTFIHEMIHAEIFRKLLSVAQHPSIQLDQNQLIQLRNDYPGLYDYYMRWKWNVPQGQSPSSAQHEAMAQHYRDIIKQALKEFDNTLTEETYNALSWIGLMGSGTFNATTGLYSNSTQAWINTPQTQRLNIISTINTFNSTNPNCQ